LPNLPAGIAIDPPEPGRMKRPKGRNRRTDYGTIALHWLLVGALMVAAVTGLRIASEAPDRTWINTLDLFLPRSMVWTAHMPAALVLVAVAIAYPVYVSLAGLIHRIRFDRFRLFGLLGKSETRWGSINVGLYWIFYAALIVQIVTGGALYFGYANSILHQVHWIGMWVICAYAILHVLAHLRLGGTSQLFRIFRPAPHVAPPPPFDPAELIAFLAERSRRKASFPQTGSERHQKDPQMPHQSDRLREDRSSDHPSTAQAAEPERRAHVPGKQRAPRRRGAILHANPLVTAAVAGLFGVGVLVTLDRQMVDTLQIRHIAASEAPLLDGDTSDPVWRNARPFYVATQDGGNFDGKGETTIEIRAVHDGKWAYFLFAWDDPTRSLKHLPLRKSADGWRLLHDGYERGDEHAYHEDKLAVLLTKSDLVLAGDRTFHAGPTPNDGLPRTLSGRGLHYTEGDGVFVDVWQWQATRGGPTGWMDDDHFGPPAKPTNAQAVGNAPYRGGFAPDPGTANYLDNFDPRAPEGFAQPIQPRRLPKNFKAAAAALGPIDLDPNHGESDQARWYLTDEESLPYSSALDAQIPVGTVIPGVIVSGKYSGDRADVRAAARWGAGRWAVEAARRLDTGSPYDVPIETGTSMRVAAFDHSQIRHTRHVRPIRLEVE
jgi:hypothetical protein